MESGIRYNSTTTDIESFKLNWLSHAVTALQVQFILVPWPLNPLMGGILIIQYGYSINSYLNIFDSTI